MIKEDRLRSRITEPFDIISLVVQPVRVVSLHTVIYPV